MLPQHLIVEFWKNVRDLLTGKYDLNEKNAEEAISRYRQAIDRHGIGDLTYHNEPETIAETIARGWEQGFPEPAAR